MPIVFSAIVPHPPVLIPEIGKDNAVHLAETVKALKTLEQELYAAKPESLVIIGPDDTIMPESFSINLAADYTAEFKEFGDYAIQLHHRSDYLSVQEIRAADESNKSVPIVLTSNQSLGHAFGVPLFFLAQHIKDVPIIPITYSGQEYQKNFDFGVFLHGQLSNINKRFAVIASVDLSNKLTKEAPGGYSPSAEAFDQAVVDALKKHDSAALLGIDPYLAQESGEAGVRAIAVLLGILKEINVAPVFMAYEKPFGVGYATFNYQFK